MKSEFGQRATDARKRQKLTQTQVCKALGIGQSTLGYIESEATGSTWTARLATFYGVDALWLESGVGNMENPKGVTDPRVSGSSFGGMPPTNGAAFHSGDLPAIEWAALGTLMTAEQSARSATTTPSTTRYAHRWVRVGTEEMSPEICAGDEIKLDPSAKWGPGSVIVCADAAGIWHLRRVQDVGAGDWVAVATNTRAYAPLKSAHVTSLCRVVSVRSSRDI